MELLAAHGLSFKRLGGGADDGGSLSRSGADLHLEPDISMIVTYGICGADPGSGSGSGSGFGSGFGSGAPRAAAAAAADDPNAHLLVEKPAHLRLVPPGLRQTIAREVLLSRLRRQQQVATDEMRTNAAAAAAAEEAKSAAAAAAASALGASVVSKGNHSRSFEADIDESVEMAMGMGMEVDGEHGGHGEEHTAPLPGMEDAEAEMAVENKVCFGRY